MERAFQVCRNCKRSMASAHFALHEAHCLQFLVICPECEEPIPRVKMEEHCRDKHQQAKKFQERPTECQFCDLAVQLNKLKVHESYCGKQTEFCPDCGLYIMLRVLAQHKNVCQSKEAWLGKGERMSTPETKIYCSYCKQIIPGNKYAHHMDECCPNSESEKHFPIGKPEIPPPSLTSQAAENQTSTVETDVHPKIIYKNRFSFSQSPLNTALNGKNKTINPFLKSELNPRTTSLIEDEAAYDILRRCSQCGILLPLPTLNRHQEKCWWLASSKGKQVRNSS
ncbi:XIAP-associated factor 1 isoform X2 [Carlito syrichta]|uniref:XIAP-associated factor 1 isoform X2 n=1 Tax=Carlito syrichta TaxID=1868482 RepID=A0A3Q0EHM8_CARSF|nr:XIAP-associated factor 1 isoform X2 [Carlito syrichta]